MEMYSIKFNDDSLEHHGILGQRWGKKNGPPYPLDDKDHSQTEKKAGWKKSVGKSAAKTASATVKAAGKVASSSIKANVDDSTSKDKKKEANAKANSIEEATNKASSKLDELSKEQVDLSNMSDEELRKRVNRLNMEQQYRNLTGTTTVKTGKDYAKTILAASADILIPVGTVVLAEVIRKKMNNK